MPDDNGTEEMLQVHSQPTSSHPRISTIIGSSCDDNISEQYAEVTDLTSGMASDDVDDDIKCFCGLFAWLGTKSTVRDG